MWIKIFSSEDEMRQKLLPDKPQLLIVHGKQISLIWHGEHVYAIQDFCSHNKESLSKGQVNFVGEIICPWHGYCFNLKTGREAQERSADLETFATKINKDGLWIKIDSLN